MSDDPFALRALVHHREDPPLKEIQQPGSSVPFVARRYGISPSLLYSCKRSLLEGGRQAVHADEEVVGTSRVRELERRVRDLECLIPPPQKTDFAAQFPERFGGRFAAKAVAATLGIARTWPSA